MQKQFEPDFRLRFRKNLWQVFVEMICVCLSHSRKFSPTHVIYFLAVFFTWSNDHFRNYEIHNWFSRFFLTNQIVFWQKKNTASNVKVQFLWEGHKDLVQPSSRFWRYLVMSKPCGRLRQILVAFSEKLNFTKRTSIKHKLSILIFSEC